MTQAQLEAELAALREAQPPSAAAAAAAVQATCRLQESLLAREREIEGGLMWDYVAFCLGGTMRD